MNCSLLNCTNVSRIFQGAPLNQINRPIQAAMTIVYVVTFLVGFLGNALGIYIVKRRGIQKHVLFFLIVNLACADLLAIFAAMPYHIVYLFIENRWFGGLLGTISCKLIHFVFGVSIAASILTVLAISCDRFVAVVLPLKISILNRPQISSCLIWVTSSLFFAIYLFVFTVKFKKSDRKYYCRIWWKSRAERYHVMQIFYLLVLFALYVVPLLILIAVHVSISLKLWHRRIPGCQTETNRLAAERSKRKVAKLLIAIVVVFALCWLPAHFMHLHSVFRPQQFVRIPIIWKILAFWLCQANSSLNPIIYIIMNEDFRKEFIKILKSLFCSTRTEQFSNSSRRTLRRESTKKTKL